VALDMLVVASGRWSVDELIAQLTRGSKGGAHGSERCL
jgi:hypothetical protein